LNVWTIGVETGRERLLNNPFTDVQHVQTTLAEHGYVADTGLATAIYLAFALERPLFLEGEAGVGKTEVAKVVAAATGRPLIRLQCYEGIDRASALYEWNHPRQLLRIRIWEAARTAAGLAEAGGDAGSVGKSLEAELFSSEFLLRRPLLAAIDSDCAPVLLIDEVDRSDEEFEAFLLELLGEYQVTIPELGTIRAREVPFVVLTSNRTREVHDALKRRCLYYWIDYPSFDKELRIVRDKVPGLPEQLAAHACGFVQRLRREPLFKLPGVAETLQWAMALEALGTKRLTPERVEETIGCLLKYRDDLDLVLRAKDPGSASIRGMLAEIGVI
jgi:MoxR-like ATPase